MDFKSLSYFAAIAKYQNLTKAADALYVGQPTLSKFLSSLEKELGLKLFTRNGNRYDLTFAGECYLEKVNGILRLKEDLDTEMSDILNNDKGVIKAAFAPMRSSYMLQLVLPAYEKKYPNVKVELVEGNSDSNDRKLIEGTVDVAFSSKPYETNPLIDYKLLCDEELLICTSRDSQLKQYAEYTTDGKYPKIDLKYIVNERVLMMQPQQRTRQIVDGILKENGIVLNDVLYTSNIRAIIGLASAGYGVSFVFESHLKHCALESPVECFSFGNNRVVGEFVAATRKGGYISQYTAEFIETVRTIANE